jgi:hypothetical protein
MDMKFPKFLALFGAGQPWGLRLADERVMDPFKDPFPFLAHSRPAARFTSLPNAL